jgi:Tol biopolymer transport system component
VSRPGLAQQPAYGSPRVAEIVSVLPAGARAKFTPAGDKLIFDRRNPDGYYDLYVSDLEGRLLATFSEGKPGVVQRHNGNGIFHPSSAFLAFISEEDQHYLNQLGPYGQIPVGEPGVGLFNNLWFTDGQGYWKATNIPLKQTADDGLPVFATVNPRFSPDGSRIVWTERYAEGGNNNWGKWRLKIAELVAQVSPRQFSIRNERILFTPSTGTYVTAMKFIRPGLLLISGNLNGQHEYGMDLYTLDIVTGALKNLTNSPDDWEEGACVSPSGRTIVYMTNRDSPFRLDTSKDWVGQPVERDYYLMNADGTGKERLTYFNDSSKRDYQGWRAVTIICDVSPDGKTIAGTVGRDYGDDTLSRLHWTVWLIRLKTALP